MSEPTFNPNPLLPGQCESCSSHYPRWSIKYQELGIWQCQSCQSLSYFSKDGLDPRELYSEAYFQGGEYLDYTGHAAAHEANARRKLRLLQRFTTQPLEIFELGCAYGYFIKVARESGIENAFGIDASRVALDYARKYVGPYFGEIGDEPVFDFNCLVAWDVWEHLEHPLKVFREHVGKLRPGGLVAVTTVDSGSMVARLRGKKWRQIHPPTHLHYPTARALEMNFKSMGCEILYHKSFSPARALESYTHALGIRIPSNAKALRNFSFKLNLYDVQLLICRKLT
jgi:2-polyprenyl-3-methyl-5-hydroxy-6-metoxy-1,4-benzoquinol methylase